MTIIPLQRRFLRWSDKDRGDPDLLSLFYADSAALGWEQLLAKHRVVILAEPGSGKSEELKEQARLNAGAGRFAFYATVQGVGRKGMDSALGKAGAAKLAAWRESNQPAWFFLDSVDEAKAGDIRFEDALREVADGIDGAEGRAHIILSGRHTDWEFRRDLESLEKWIGMPPADLPAPTLDPNELIINVIRRHKAQRPPPPAETPLVVLMGALDRAQVEVFTRGKGVVNVEDFFAALEKANLWDFARRPLDLDWLVGYWRTHGKLGALARMLELSLRERLQEPDAQRSRRDALDIAHAMEALERIGAALVLARLDTIVVPDSSLSLSEAPAALDLAEILPDWSGVDRGRLISRAVFDPASAGFVRLHNDNQGGVRSFLAARWLIRLRKANCPKSAISDLLFATTYGVELVKPSMRQTAAWLSLWDTDVARDIVARDPLLLMDAADPASLPLPTREAVLARVCALRVGDDDMDMLDRDSLKRFSSPDLASCVRSQWDIHSDSAPARELLLRMIWLGELDACADLAVGASFGIHSDRYTQVFSGRALMATADVSEKRSYAEYIRDHAASVLTVLVWDAIDSLFPTTLSVADLLLILRTIDVSDRNGGLGLDYLGPTLVDRLSSGACVEELLSGLLDLLETKLSTDDEEEFSKDHPFLSTIEAAGSRLLKLSPIHVAPLCAIDAALRVGKERRYQQRTRARDTELFSMLQSTRERRRTTFWRAAERIAESELLTEPLEHPWQIAILGLELALQPEDLDWLLDDAVRRHPESEKRLAANTVMQLWRQSGSSADTLHHIETVGSHDIVVTSIVVEWTRPRSPSDEEQKHRRQMRRLERRSTVELAERDKSWVEFAERLRGDPGQLRRIASPNDSGVDTRLFHLWQLVNAVGTNQSRYAVDDLGPLEPMLGSAVVGALRDAFINFWRHWKPRLRSEKPVDQRNTISALDCIGIVGVTLESVQRPGWATRLSHDEAVLATTYGTLEINGLPNWFTDLAKAQGNAVRELLTRSIAPELTEDAGERRRDTLQDISGAHEAIVGLLAEQLYAFLEERDDLPTVVLDPVLRIVRRGLVDRTKLATLLAARFETAAAIDTRTTYIVALFRLDAGAATTALLTKLATMDRATQTALVQLVLPKVFGDAWRRHGKYPGNLPFEAHERLVTAAYATIRMEDDKDHSDGKAFSPDDRDNAESARSTLFGAFVDTPGLATFNAIHRFAADASFPIPRKRLMALAAHRAGQDSETAQWQSADVRAFETDFLTTPRTSVDLQRVALRRLVDLQHDLLHSDFAQGKTVARLPKEVDVQLWFADALRRSQGRSYSVEREPHTVEEKEPDVRFRAKATDASVPMEIKVVESWTLFELEAALTAQLVGRYLRDRIDRYGILLLVHQKARALGWKNEAGTFLNFSEVIQRLRALAGTISAERPNAPQVEIAVVDVSGVG
jgi:hypothetical protein